MQTCWKKETQETERLLRVDSIEIKGDIVNLGVEYNVPGMSNGYTCTVQKFIDGDEQAESLIKKFWSEEIYVDVLKNSRALI